MGQSHSKMPFFTKVFKPKDGATARSKKHGKHGGSLDDASVKPKWDDAWLRTEVEPEEIHELIRGCTNEIKARALDMPFLLLPFRPASDPSAARTFIRNYFKNGPSTAENPMHGEQLTQELRLTDPMVLCSVMKWCWSRLAGGIVTWEAYELFRMGEQDSNMARDAFATFIPISVESDARTRIVFDFFDLMAAIAAHGKLNGLGGRKLSRYAGWWAFTQADTGLGFDGGYKNWDKAANATSHLFFAYLRSLSPETNTHGISHLPMSLQALLQSTEYPPERPSLMQNTTIKVVMIVDSVSPTPFSLLRRTRNFQYRDDDRALQELSNYEDPVKALTDECRRVLKCISSANQSTGIVSTSKTSTSLRDASWSRFEDIGFASLDESDQDSEFEASTLSMRRPDGLRTEPHSRSNDLSDLARPTTPSWADFLSSGFTDETSMRTSPSLLLPPDKILPPINATQRGQSSQSHRRGFDEDSCLEPGELASINTIDLDDSFWWVWITSLSSEEIPERKAAFGRCAAIETNIRGARWMVIEEQVKGAGPEPDPNAYIAEKKSRFLFGRKKGVTRRKSTGGKKAAAARVAQPVASPSKISVGSDQHARIQAAARALQDRQRDNAQGQEKLRRGRLDEISTQKTTSVYTLQPMIMREAGPAMKWAKSYDKDAVRAAYLGENFAEHGLQADQLSTITSNDEYGTNRMAASTSALPTGGFSKDDLDRDLPAVPAESMRAKSERVLSPEPTTPKEKDTFDHRGILSSPDKHHRLERKPVAVRVMTPEHDPTSVTSSPEKPKSSDSHKLQKRQKNGGFKGIFGRKKTTRVSERAAAIEATQAALNGKPSKQSGKQVESPIAAEIKAARRFSGFSRKKVPIAEPETVQEDVHDEPVTIEAPAPAPEIEPRGPSQDMAREIHDEKQSVAESSSFKQAPFEDAPAFIPDDSSRITSPDSDTTSSSDAAESFHEEPVVAVASELSKPKEGPTTTMVSHDRWAQIKKNAAERAARASEEQSRGGRTMTGTDDGDTSGEETIESRVARIKARVAELTGNIENARM